MCSRLGPYVAYPLHAPTFWHRKKPPALHLGRPFRGLRISGGPSRCRRAYRRLQSRARGGSSGPDTWRADPPGGMEQDPSRLAPRPFAGLQPRSPFPEARCRGQGVPGPKSLLGLAPLPHGPRLRRGRARFGRRASQRPPHPSLSASRRRDDNGRDQLWGRRRRGKKRADQDLLQRSQPLHWPRAGRALHRLSRSVGPLGQKPYQKRSSHRARLRKRPSGGPSASGIPSLPEPTTLSAPEHSRPPAQGEHGPSDA